MPLATVRARYQAIVGPADAAFEKFSSKLETLSSATTPAELDAYLKPAAAAVAQAGRELYALRRSTTPAIAKGLYAVALSDNTVWQALEDLEAGWGSRSFEVSSWQSAYVQALRAANAAAGALRRALGGPGKS